MRRSATLTWCIALAAAVAGLAAPVAWAGGFDDYATMGKAWEMAYNTGDPAAVAAFYSENGMRMPPNSEAVEGRDAIQAHIQALMDGNVPKVKIETVEYEIAGEVGFARGTYAVMDASGATVDQGKWAQVGKKIDGKWYTYFDIWNSDQPMPMPEEE